MTNPASIPPKRRGYRAAARIVLTTATAAAFVGAASLSASAAPGETSGDTTQVNVDVSSTIILTMDPSFTLSGAPRDTASASVDGNVLTNNPSGYSIEVATTAPTLVPLGAGNTDTIPIASLEVADVADDFQPVGAAAVLTNTKPTRSGATGDAFTDDYQMVIPNVAEDIYSATLNYTATTLA